MKPKVIVKIRYYKQDSKRRAFYSSAQSDDYMAYVDKGSKAETYDYLEYAGNAEKSAGVFGKNGLFDKLQKKELRKMLRATESCIWDIVISFEEDFGKRYLNGTEDALFLLKARLNRFLRQAGFTPENVEWFAGLHENTDNRHIHLCFFEREPMRYRQEDRNKKYYHGGNIAKNAIDRFKLSIEEYFSDTAVEVKKQRKQLLDSVQNTLQSPKNYSRKIAGLMLRLRDRIPRDGRLAYESENMNSVRILVDEITTCLILGNQRLKGEFKAFKGVLDAHNQTIIQAAENQHMTNYDAFLLSQKAVTDLYRRIGNKVIRQAMQVKRRQKKQQNVARRKRYERDKLSDLLENTATLNAICEQEAMECFHEFLEKLEDAELESYDEYAM